MLLLTEGQSLSRLFDLDWQLLADSVLMLVAIFFLFLSSQASSSALRQCYIDFLICFLMYCVSILMSH